MERAIILKTDEYEALINIVKVIKAAEACETTMDNLDIALQDVDPQLAYMTAQKQFIKYEALKEAQLTELGKMIVKLLEKHLN